MPSPDFPTTLCFACPASCSCRPQPRPQAPIRVVVSPSSRPHQRLTSRLIALAQRPTLLQVRLEPTPRPILARSDPSRLVFLACSSPRRERLDRQLPPTSFPTHDAFCPLRQEGSSLALAILAPLMSSVISASQGGPSRALASLRRTRALRPSLAR